jgi:hypothetical protein
MVLNVVEFGNFILHFVVEMPRQNAWLKLPLNDKIPQTAVC